jgi:hypothetical protein
MIAATAGIAEPLILKGAERERGALNRGSYSSGILKQRSHARESPESKRAFPFLDRLHHLGLLLPVAKRHLALLQAEVYM